MMKLKDKPNALVPKPGEFLIGQSEDILPFVKDASYCRPV